jgi:ribose 5-phosphate isomerase A
LSPHGPAERGKEAAGARAAEAVTPGMTLGLGSGSTVDYFLSALGRRCRDGELPGVRGVPTSLRTEHEASAQGIPLTTLEEARSLDLTVDGADEVNPELDLIKGLGGALLREKMVAQSTRRLVIIVDEGKLVHRLGTRGALPVEVVPFAWKSHLPYLASLGAQAELGTGPDGTPYVTDNGNLILHCRFPQGIEDPRALEMTLASRSGIVETGLFLGLAQEVLVGGEGGVRSLSRTGGKDS